MRKHSDAIKKIRQTLKALAAKKPALRAEIQALKFGSNGERRPETGPERCAMKLAYNRNVRPDIRTHLIAYGLLRGIPYAKMEPKANDLPYFGYVLHDIHEAIGDNAALKAEWTEDRVATILNEGVDPLAASEAA